MKLFWKTAVFLTIAAFLTACSGAVSEPEEAVEEEAVEIVEVEEAVVETAVPTVAPTIAPTEPPVQVNLDDLGPAPEIENEVWLNTDQPLPLATQRGKVVLLEFWTFG